MVDKKIKKKTMLSFNDLEYNRSLGLPIEVFCPLFDKTVAFGRIEALSEHGVIVNQSIYSSHEYLFFGLTKKKVMLYS